MTRVSAMLLARASCVALLRRVHRGGCDHLGGKSQELHLPPAGLPMGALPSLAMWQKRMSAA